jgi:hypothetical protein
MKLRSMIPTLILGGAAVVTLGTAGAVIASCSTSQSYGTTAAVAGSADMHCILMDGGSGGASYLQIQPTSQAECNFRPPIDAPPPPMEAGAPDAPPPASPYGATLYNSSGRDDDCKYYVQWKSTAADENNNVYFLATAQLNAETPSVPLTGAYPYIEAYLNDTHPAPPTNQTYKEGPPGTYKIGPIQFDAIGMWTVRFHWNGSCFDYSPESPHGHSAFYVNVTAK